MVSTPRLKINDKYCRYSPAEQRVFSLLPLEKRQAIDTTELTYKYYGGKNKVPLNGRNIVVGTLRALIRKAEYNGEDFKIMRTPRSGPHSTSVWIQR